MNDTPETDAFSVSFKSIDDPLGKKQWVPVDLARRLERERDEAREELHDIRLNLGEDADGYTLLHAVCVIQNERDEARDNAERYRLEANAMMMQRDEAREALMKIEDLFIDGTDIYADRENMGLIAKKALEETK